MFYDTTMSLTLQLQRPVGLHVEAGRIVLLGVNKQFYDAMSNVTMQFICSFIVTNLKMFNCGSYAVY